MNVDFLFLLAQQQQAGGGGPQFVGAAPATLVPENATTVVNIGTVIAGVQDGDYVLGVWAADSRNIGSLTFNTGAGLAGGPTLLPNQDNSTLSPGHFLGSWIYSSSNPSISITNADGASTANGVLLLVAFRGASSPAAAQVAQASGASGNPNPPALSGVQSGSIVLAAGFLDDDAATFTAPTGYTIASQGSSQSSNAGSAVLAYQTASEGGTFDPGAFTSTGDDSWYAYTIELRAAP